jgi:hypothetical protein
MGNSTGRGILGPLEKKSGWDTVDGEILHRRWLKHVETLSGWWLSPTPLKNDGVKVSWDYEIPEDVEKKHVPNHQLAINNGM